MFIISKPSFAHFKNTPCYFFWQMVKKETIMLTNNISCNITPPCSATPTPYCDMSLYCRFCTLGGLKNN